MRSSLVLLLLAAFSDAVIDFKTSQLIDESDIQSTNVQISCPGTGGCTVYTTKMATASVAIFDGATQKATLKEIYQTDKDGYLVGYDMNPGNNYVLKKIDNQNENVKVYVVANTAGAGLVRDFYSNDWNADFDLKSAGTSRVTVLSAMSTGMSFSKYEGTKAPKIYSAGFDMIDSCKPVYIATSVDNAAKSTIGVVSALVTVDFGSTDASNKYHVQQTISYTTRVPIGQSVVAMSPGYTGCTVQHNYNNANIQDYQFQGGEQSSKADIKFSDMKIAQGHELLVQATGQKDHMISGSDTQSYSFVSSNLVINFLWRNPNTQSDYYCAQIDFNNGVSRVFGVGTLIALVFMLLGN